MLLSEFIKDYGVKKYFRTPKNIKYSLLANFIQLVLEGDWIGKEEINQDFSQNSLISKYFKTLDPETDTLRFGDVYIILSPDRYRYGVFLNPKAVLEQPNHLNPQHVLLKDDITKHIEWVLERGYEVVLLRPINQKNIFPSDDLRYIKQDKPFASIEYDEKTKNYIIYAPGNYADYDNPIWANDPTNKQIEELAKQDVYKPLWAIGLRNTGTPIFTPVEGEFDGETFTTWKIPDNLIDNDKHIFALIQSSTTEYTINQLKWTGNSYHDDFIRKADKKVTVGLGADYLTINEAIAALVRSKPVAAYKKHGYNTVIELISSFTMAEQIIVRNQDLSWITITTQLVGGNKVEIPINPLAITEILQKDESGPIDDPDEPGGIPANNDNIIPVIGVDNGKAPVIDVQFYYPDSGDGYGNPATTRDGAACVNNGLIMFKPFSGVRRARNGLKVLYKGDAQCYIPGMTILNSEGESNAGNTRGVDFSYALNRGLHLMHGATVNLPRSKFDHALGDYGGYIIYGCNANLFQSDFSYAINGFALTTRDNSRSNIRQGCTSHSVRGVHALHNAFVDARSDSNPESLVAQWVKDGAQYCTRYGVLANGNGHIEAASLNVSNCGNIGVNVSSGSTVAFDLGIANDCVGAGVVATNASTVAAPGASAQRCTIGFKCEKASTMNIEGANADDCTLRGLSNEEAGIMNANLVSAKRAGMYGSFNERSAITNVRGSNFDDAGINGIYSDELSQVNARTTSCLTAGGYVPSDGEEVIGANGTVTPGVPVVGYGYFVRRSGTIVIGEPGSSVVNGTLSQPVNIQTAKGAIWNENLPTPVEELSTNGFIYKGTYAPNTNVATPITGATYGLSNGTGRTGDAYRITTAGARNFGAGNIRFDVGDFVLYNGSVWVKLDTSDRTTSWKVKSSGLQVQHTGDTTEFTLATITIPGGSLGANGVLRMTANFSHTNNANVKTLKIKVGGTSYINAAAANQSRTHAPVIMYNRNSQSSQIGGTNSGNTSGFGQSTSSQVTSSINTANDFDVVITGQLTDPTDTVTLESYLLEYHYEA